MKTKKHPSDNKHHDLFVTTKYSDAFWGIRVTLTVDAPIKIVITLINVAANIFLYILKLFQRGLLILLFFISLKFEVTPSLTLYKRMKYFQTNQIHHIYMLIFCFFLELKYISYDYFIPLFMLHIFI